METIPVYQYSLVYGIIAQIAAPLFDMDSMSWVVGRPFKAEDYHSPVKIILGVFGDIIEGPSPAHIMHKLYLSTLILILAWLYFDHVDSSNRGVAYSPIFFLEKNYWLNLMPPKY